MRPVAKQDDFVVGLDTHIVLVPGPGGAAPTPMPMPFSGPLSTQLCERVLAEGKPVATEGSGAANVPSHLPIGGSFQRPPANRATVVKGSERVQCGGRAVARATDPAMCCSDPVDQVSGHVIAAGKVVAG
jgi:uncharacterized Zn-binding protein involved in type VI secretion